MGLMTYTIQKDAPEFPAGVAGGPNPVPVLLYGLDTTTNSWMPLSELPGLPGPTGQPQVVEARMMVYRGGTWVPWDGNGAGNTPDPLPVAVINNVLYDDAAQHLVINLAAPVPGASIQVVADAGFVITSAVADATAQQFISLLAQPGQTITVRVNNGGSEAVWSYAFPAAAPPVIAYHYYDEANQQLVVATAAIAPAGYQLVIRDAGGLPMMVYSLSLPQLEHRLSLPARPGEAATIQLVQGDTVLSTTTFIFPGTPAPAPTDWGTINGIHWQSTGLWYNDQGWWATAPGAVLTGTGFTPGGGAALEFELTSGVLNIEWRNGGGEIITGSQVQAGPYQLQIPDGAVQVVVTSYDPAQYGPIWINNFSLYIPAS